MALHSFSTDIARSLGGPDWLVARRLGAAEEFAGSSMPTSTEEIWRYSRIDELDLERFRPASSDDDPMLDAPAPGGGPVAAEAGARSGLVVTRNGSIVHCDLDDDLTSKGVTVSGLSSLVDSQVASRAQELLGTCAKVSADALVTLSDAFCRDVVVVHVPPGVVIEKPIVSLHWARDEGLASFPRVLVIAEENSEVTVLDRFFSPQNEHLVVPVVELVVGESARVSYLAVQDHGSLTWHIGTQRAHIARNGLLRSSAVALGGDYARHRSEAFLSGEGAMSEQVAVYFGDGTQLLDFRTLADHDAPRTRSDLLFKGAVEDQAHSVYSGLVRLRPAAVKAVAVQSNRNLVLTPGAGAESIPNLEIEANDVRCSHASTVGPIDEDQRYYLESRGVTPAESQRLIVMGFFEDVFDRLPVPSLVSRLRSSVATKVRKLTDA